ncbi:flagellar hook-basal body protein [Bacillus sp. DNRA2]|uniref:flagellar hook-basal body protein n=1 Tax=Bacillus sp. DNRA2 TaxID=2723053 RepID=UPI00145D3AA0|nr:flagellar hook-basal body protein [Bacillus sp. DNRA2]NMD69127.1 flagellar hook-basal body protein [Bacillus sp. DNRA2]
MNTSISIAAGSLRAYQQKLDTISNNVANVNTPGFKRTQQSFSEILANQINNQPGATLEVGRQTPNGVRPSYGVRTGLTQMDTTQGAPMQTDNPFALMINGNGFFQIGVPSQTVGGAMEMRYTRDGNFQLSPNPNSPGTYNLVHPNGGYLLDQNGSPIVLNDQNEVQFQSNGDILLKNKNSVSGESLSGQRVGIVDIQNPNLLKNMGGNQYMIDPAVLPNGTNPANFVRTMGANEISVSAGYLEASNVDLATEMTELLLTQRGFQLNARAMSYADQMLGIANGIMK